MKRSVTIWLKSCILSQFQTNSSTRTEKRDLLEDLDFNCDKPPSLLPLIGENSWFMFSLLDLAKVRDMPWLTCPSSFWPFVDQFKTFIRFVNSLEVVNDCSEQAVKLVSEFVNLVHDEEDRQELLLAVQHRRDQLKGSATKAELQTAYEAIVKEKRS